MRFLIISLILIAGCSESTTLSESTSELPEGTIITDYAGVNLQKATVKTGEAITEEGDVLNGKRHGTWTTYFTDGKIQTITSYMNGVKQGPQLQIDNAGNITSRTAYVQDQMEGEYRAYNRGKLIEKKFYANGKLNGMVQKFYPSGTIMEQSNYVDGQIDGEAIWYNSQGEITIQYVYDMGELIDDGSTN